MGYRQYSIEDDSQEAALHVEKALHHANKALWHMGKTMSLVQSMCEGQGAEEDDEITGYRSGYRGGRMTGNRSGSRNRSNYRKDEDDMMPEEYDEFGNPENFRRSRDSMGRFR